MNSWQQVSELLAAGGGTPGSRGGNSWQQGGELRSYLCRKPLREALRARIKPKFERIVPIAGRPAGEGQHITRRVDKGRDQDPIQQSACQAASDDEVGAGAREG